MRSFFAKHFAVLVTGTVINLPFLWKGAVWITDWLARFDFWVTHRHELQGLDSMFGLLTNPPPWMVFVTGGIAVLIVLWDIRHPNTLRNLTTAKNRMGLYLGIAIACLVLGTGFGFAAYWQYKYPPPPAPAVTELYKAAYDNFRHSGGISEQTEVVQPDMGMPPVTVKIWVRSDLNAMAKFLVFYIPTAIDMPASPGLAGIPHLRQTYEAVKQMADRFSDVIKRVDSTGSSGLGDMGADNMRYSTEALFTGAIYIYHEGDLTDAERVELRSLYANRGARAFFRGWRYLRESRPAVTH
jgi:hypothetical protein